MKQKKLIFIALSILALFLFAGCQTLIEKATKKAVEEKTGVSVNEENGSIKIKDKKGNAELQTSENKLPEGFPKDFPIYDNTKVVSGSKVTQENKTSFYVSWESSDSVKDIAAFYDKSLPENGYTVKNSIESDKATVYTTSNNSTISIAEENGKTVISTIIFEE